MRPDDVERAVDELISRVPAPAVDAASTIARGHERIVRRRVVLTGVSVALLATIAAAGALADSHHTTSIGLPERAPGTTSMPLAPDGAQSIDIAVASSVEAWKCTNPLQYTDNGGQTWRSIAASLTDSAVSGNPNSLCAAAAGGNVWAVQFPHGLRPGPVLRVRYASRSRVLPFPLVPAETQALSIAFIDVDHGWVATTWIGETGTATATRNLYRTPDGGRTWDLVGSNVPVGSGFQFTSPTQGWALGSAFDLMTTVDGGATWRRVALPAAPKGSFLAQVVAHAASVVVWRGEVTGVSDRAFFDVSTDGGRSWSRRGGPDGLDMTNVSPLGFDAPDAVHLRFLAAKLWVSDDGGRTWVPRPAPPVASVRSMSFPTPDVGWISGSARRSGAPVLLRTSDAGRSWTDVTNN